MTTLTQALWSSITMVKSPKNGDYEVINTDWETITQDSTSIYIGDFRNSNIKQNRLTYFKIYQHSVVNNRIDTISFHIAIKDLKVSEQMQPTLIVRHSSLRMALSFYLINNGFWPF
jgi:hypothetical protein